MVFPPPVLPTNNTNTTASVDIHPALHNNANSAINDTVARLVDLIAQVNDIQLTPGANGKTILNGVGAPALTLGTAGDFYLATDTITLYGPKVEGATPSWGPAVSLVGPAGTDGAAGTNGAPGADGKTVRYGAGAPDGALGDVDDFYIDTTTYDLYGPKVGGATPVWPPATSLIGPVGPSGAGIKAVGEGSGTTPVQIMIEGATPTNYLLPSGRAHIIKISAVATQTLEGATPGPSTVAGFTWEGVVARGGSESARIVDLPLEAGWADPDAVSWLFAVAVDTTDPANNYLRITGTGETNKTVRWTASIETTEVGI